jgi:hypothetical protein
MIRYDNSSGARPLTFGWFAFLQLQPGMFWWAVSSVHCPETQKVGGMWRSIIHDQLVWQYGSQGCVCAARGDEVLLQSAVGL